jgi:exopolysaccharide biosynthesis polyprenyl glycosylphosphotransferase
MNRSPITQQTTADAMPLGGALGRAAPPPQTALRGAFRGPLQWALGGRGWVAVRAAVDLAMLCGAVILALGGVSPALQAPVRAPVLALPALAMVLLYLRGFYRTRLRELVLDGIVPLIGAVSVATMAVITLGVLADGRAPSQRYAVRGWLFALLAVGVGRTLLYLAQRWARAGRVVGRPVLIVGAGLVGSRVARRLEDHPEYGLLPVGFLDDEPRSAAEVGGRDVPVLGTLDDLDEAVRSTGVRQLIVAFSSVADGHLSGLVQHCQDLGIGVCVVPRMFDTINHRASYDTVGGLPLMALTAVDPRGVQFALKDAFDRVLALALLLILSPVMIFTALAVRLSSGGPVLFRQRRVGRDCRPFELYKFRSMRSQTPESREGDDDRHRLEYQLDADTAPGGVEGEDRRTPVGRFLRRLSLDELPQLVNVVRGEMSIIGPRPERPEYVEQFTEEVSRYGDRHRVKAGITGWAQVHGLRGQTSLSERVEWDNYYIAHWSLGLDLKILVLTLLTLFRNAT